MDVCFVRFVIARRLYIGNSVFLHLGLRMVVLQQVRICKQITICGLRRAYFFCRICRYNLLALRPMQYDAFYSLSCACRKSYRVYLLRSNRSGGIRLFCRLGRLICNIGSCSMAGNYGFCLFCLHVRTARMPQLLRGGA